MSTEIGEAVITHTIFGRAKVRIIRKHDKMRRTLWLLALLAAIAAAAAAWQGWISSQQAEPLQSTDPAPSLSANVQESVAAALPLAESKPITPPQAEVNDTPQQAQALQEAGRTPANPVAPQSKPQTPPLTANSSAARSPADAQQSSRPTPPKQPAVSPNVAAPRAMQPSAQPAASSPAAVVPLDIPPLKEDTPIQAPAGNKQAAEPVNTLP